MAATGTPIAHRLTDAFRVISIDLRGHGESEIPDGIDLVWTGMAQDILAVIDHFDLADVRVAGHSMGGCSAVLAEQVRPGTITAAWLFEPIVMPNDSAMYRSGPNPLVEMARRRREVFDTREAAYDRYASRPPFDTSDPASLWAYVDWGFEDMPDGSVRLKCRGEIEAQVFEHSRTNAFEGLASVQTAAVVAGGNDPEGPAKAAPMIAEALPNARFDLYNEYSHFGPMEAPDVMADAIRAAVITPLTH